jgi:pre-mRNA branch site protein p14
MLIFFFHRGDKPDTRGTAFVVYEDIYDAKNAVDHLSGFNVCGRYLIVLYYQQSRMQKSLESKQQQQ